MGERTYKQLNWTSRIKLETMLKHGHSKKEIAEELGPNATAQQIDEKMEEKMAEIIAQLQNIDIPVQA